MRLYLIVTIVVFLIFGFIYYQGIKDCEKKHLLEEKQNEIITKEIIINENKKVNERRNKALVATPDDNILWLRENDCQDCR